MARADRVLLVVDCADEDADQPEEGLPPQVPVTLVRNKIDLVGEAPGVAEAVSALTSGLNPELTGLFVEDDNLMRLCGLPFAREVTLDTGLERVAVSSTRGEASFPALPLGRYTVIASLDGFATVKTCLCLGV